MPIIFFLGSLKMPVLWSTYGPGKKGCAGEGYGLTWGPSNLQKCKESCIENYNCNSFAWDSKEGYCYLKNKQDACDDVPCDWNSPNNLDHWHFYWMTCGNFSLENDFQNIKTQKNIKCSPNEY